MAQWNHNICDLCWQNRCEAQGNAGRAPVRIKNAQEVKCCFCDALTISGIFVRQDPKTVICDCKDDD